VTSFNKVIHECRVVYQRLIHNACIALSFINTDTHASHHPY